MIAFNFNKVCILGLGYIGLPTSAILSSHKIEVVGVDIEEQIVDTVNKGKIHIAEPELENVMRESISKGYLRASMFPENSDAFLITVPTPFEGENKDPDISQVKTACASIAPLLKKNNLVILESTSPVGTTEKIADWFALARPDLTFPQNKGEASDIRIAYCPERVLPGNIMQELSANDRVIGGMTTLCSQAARQLYKTFVKGDCLIASSPRVAEMAKLTENSFRDVNIAFANELSLVCQELDIDVWELIDISNRHPRVNVLQPGPGVGGHCVAVDPWFIVSSAPDQAKLIKQARLINDAKPDWVVSQIESHMRKQKNCDVIIYGLTFKANVADVRESPSLYIYKCLKRSEPSRIRFCDPNIESNVLGHAGLDVVEALSSDAIHVLLVDHKEFEISRPKKGIILDFKGSWRAHF
tara:strand:- start:7035 stop:8276 length:1242 start_codon:yes stop_codon:yes gene_type:complete